jgi:hypothetical protein
MIVFDVTIIMNHGMSLPLPTRYQSRNGGQRRSHKSIVTSHSSPLYIKFKTNNAEAVFYTQHKVAKTSSPLCAQEFGRVSSPHCLG